jgi:hypothetical protein
MTTYGFGKVSAILGPRTLEQLLLRRNLCYHAAHKTIWPQKKAPFGVKLMMRGAYFLTAVAKVAA